MSYTKFHLVPCHVFKMSMSEKNSLLDNGMFGEQNVHSFLYANGTCGMIFRKMQGQQNLLSKILKTRNH